jgi:von Willebrand factor type A domain
MGVSFLTPLDALFVLAAVVPLAAVVLVQRRLASVRRAFGLGAPRRRALVPFVVALVLLPVLVGVAAAQPVVVRLQLQQQRSDAMAYIVLDTSASMLARTGRNAPTRLARAKREALQLVDRLPDIPVGIASMTDRSLPHVLPTTDLGLLRRTIRQSIGINRPPPSQRYQGRATTLQALIPFTDSHFYPPGVKHRILVVFTDGEASRPPADYRYLIANGRVLPALLIHTWSPGERIWLHGRVDPRYVSDPGSAAALAQFASITHARVFDEDEIGAVADAVHAEAGPRTASETQSEYSRVALAPWFVLGGVVPLAFLLWRRNF